MQVTLNKMNSVVEEDADVSMLEYFDGNKLYGDDFSTVEIEKWFQDEKSAYYELGAGNRQKYSYPYHALNIVHGFRHLQQGRFQRVLGMGSAYGDEFLPILKKITSITILEPATDFTVKDIHGLPVEYVQPKPTGDLPFPSESFDLVTCFGVLHHIPNVTKVIEEIFRCTSAGGYLLLREPVISMGDWRFPRRGLTKRERGIPLPILRRIIVSAGFQIVNEAKCVFPITARLGGWTKSQLFNSQFCVKVDAGLCKLPWPSYYHATNVIQKFRPWAVYYVLRKV